MKHFAPAPLLAVLVAAGTISACSGGAELAVTPRLTASADPSAVTASNDRAEAGGITTVDVPGATATVVFGINDEGVAVGRYMNGARTHGFARSSTGEITPIDFPGSGFTVAGAINNRGDIVGWYSLPATPGIRHGFLLRDGAFTSFDPPGSTFTNALGIDDRGVIVGRFCTLAVCPQAGNGAFHGFLLRDGGFTTLDVPEAIETNVWKVNDSGEILGGFGPAGGGVGLFLLQNGQFTTFALPNGKPLSEDTGGLNARGDIVGKYCDASPCLIGPTGHAFAITDGNLTTIDIPGALGTGAFGINARREVVGGYYDTGAALHGYVKRLDPGQD
jgi:uncharacterized membrane protein